MRINKAVIVLGDLLVHLSQNLCRFASVCLSLLVCSIVPHKAASHPQVKANGLKEKRPFKVCTCGVGTVLGQTWKMREGWAGVGIMESQLQAVW